MSNKKQTVSTSLPATETNQADVIENIVETNVPVVEVPEIVEDAVANPFSFESTIVATESRGLEFTPALVNLSNARALEIIQTVKNGSNELKNLGNQMMTGDTDSLISLINAVFDEPSQKIDAEMLGLASTDVLERMLESRRSDRSKTKAKGITTGMAVCLKYVATMYAELLIRIVLKKPYQSTTEYSFDSSNKDVITRKIKSLQSKKSRLSKSAKYVPADALELKSIETEIARLNVMRGTTTSKPVESKDVLADISIDKIRAMLLTVDTTQLSEEELERYNEISSRLA